MSSFLYRNSAALLLSCGALFAAACDDGQERQGQDLAACSAAKAGLETQKSQLEAKMQGLERRLNELEKRGNAIYAVEMSVVLPDVAAAASAPGGGEQLHFLTTGEWEARDGTVYRFVGRNRASDSAGHELAFSYAPLNRVELMARPIDLLSGIAKIRLDFPASLRTAGMSWGAPGTLRLEVTVNGLPVVRIERPAGADAVAEGAPVQWDVGEEFGKVPEEYTRLLLQRQSG